MNSCWVLEAMFYHGHPLAFLFYTLLVFLKIIKIGAERSCCCRRPGVRNTSFKYILEILSHKTKTLV